MKEQIRQTLRRFGYDLHRYLPASSPDAQLALALRVFGVDRVLDIGANTGQFGQLLRAIGYTGDIVSFEPLSSAHAALTAAAAADPRWTVHRRGAIGASDGEMTINIAANSASSSLRDMLDSHRDAAPEAAYVGSETVPIARLDSVAGASASATVAPATRLYVKIDTQGYEAEVIAGGPGTIAAAVAVQLEMSLVPLYAGALDFNGMLALMASHGLDLWALWPNFADPRSGRILQIDAIFARPDRALPGY